MLSKLNVLLSLSLLSMLTGCPDDTVIVDPPVDTFAPTLASGVYSVEMTSVERWQCRDSRPNDIVGEELRLALRIRGHQANADLQGLPMVGSAEPGFVYLDYTYEEPIVMQETEDHEDEDGDDTRDEGDSDASDSDESVEASAKCEVEGEDEDEGVPAPTDEDAAEPRPGISLDLAAIDPHHATGILVAEIEGCSFEVNVSAEWEGRYTDEEPVPTPDEPAQSGSGGGSTGSGGSSGGSTGSGGGSTGEEEGCEDDEADCG